ncbi:hypothetical protein OG824_32075 [Streptomyces prunicolor]|uniref:hypothetical protein n=1 Tax=Streptomyces prunicolor TaxID=67348 RepID=UPI002256A3E5|nr:hypothetical protein [Streptomyces prunicolor]MCX5239850.1 hypothetical protein [Streptomyces prunicolor]
MRPEIFQDYVLDLVKNAQGVQQTQTFEAAGEHRRPYGITVILDGRESRWQIAGQLAEGEKHDSPAADVEGEPAAYTAVDSSGSTDAWLAGVIGAAELPQIQRLDVWSARPKADPGNLGFTVHFHNGQRAFVRKL